MLKEIFWYKLLVNILAGDKDGVMVGYRGVNNSVLGFYGPSPIKCFY